MIRACIVEDDDGTASTIEKYIKKFYEQIGVPVNVCRYSAATAFLKNYDSATDVVFMDIELPELNGMEAVKELREKDRDVCVVFVTNLAQYAVGGYEVSAFDFIVKPVTYASFTMKLKRIQDYLYSKRKCEICVSTRCGKVLIKAADIKYVEIMRHMVTYHTVNGSFAGSGTLKSITDKLDGLPFALCNRCYLVNLGYVTRITGNSVFLGGGAELLISAPRRKEFINRFNEYLGAGGNVK